MSTKLEDNKYRNWVFTWNEHNVLGLISSAELQLFCEQEFELFVFQLESGEETHRKHFQGAFRTKIRTRQATLLTRFKSFFNLTEISMISINRMCGDWDENFAYCTKAETRVGEGYVSSASLREYSGSDLKVFEKGFYPWQEDLLSTLFEKDKITIKTPDDRKILWYSDPNGNCGKSKFVKYLCFTYPDFTKLSFGTAAQLRSAVINAGPFKVYLIDIPRTLGEDDSLASVITVLEDIKNGFVVSSMYGVHKYLMMEPPHIVCFSNDNCPLDLMSTDRWQSFLISMADKTAISRENYYGYS